MNNLSDEQGLTLIIATAILCVLVHKVELGSLGGPGDAKRMMPTLVALAKDYARELLKDE